MTEKIVDVVVAIIYNSKNEVLLQKKDLGYPWFPGKWCLFGGGIEIKEDKETALYREISEELGFRPDNLDFFREFNYEDSCHLGIRKGKQHVHTCKFYGDLADLALKEGAGLAFFSSEELDKYPIVEHDLAVLKEFYSKS